MKFHRKATALFSALAILGGVAVCDLPVTADNTVYAATVQLTISKSVISLGKGESFRLTANKSVKWRTSAPKIVTVDQSGNVKAVGNGTAWVTGKATDGKEKSCKITVKNAPSKITLSKGIVTIGVGEKFSVTSTIPNETACAKRTYRTSNSSIVKMTRTDWQGDFVGVKPGVAYVTVRSYNGKESTCKVTVRKAPTWVSISKKNLTMTVGDTATLSAGIASDAGCASRTFRTSNSGIVKMTKTNWTGSFTAVKPGTAYVTVRTYNGKESSCKVTVKAKEESKPSTIEVKSITLNRTTITANEKDPELPLLIATISPSNATNKTITWTSSDSSVVSVNGGNITPHKAGTVTITAKSNNGKTATCKVTLTHNHVWKAVYKTVHHDEVGHYENVDKGYNENIYYKGTCSNDSDYDEYGNVRLDNGEIVHVVDDWVSLTPMGTCTPWYTILIHNGHITNDDILNCKYDWIIRTEEKVGNDINVYYLIKTNPYDTSFPYEWFRECQDYYGSTTEAKTMFIKLVHHADWQKVWVVDKEAYDEKVLDHYECSCGATK